jgi:anti-anti-sigma factor
MEISDFETEIVPSDGDTTVKIKGDLDLYSVPEARPTILSAASRHRDGDFKIDFTGVGFVDSAGLAFLLSLRKDPALNSRLVVVVAEDSHPERILKLTRLDTFIKTISMPAPATE